MAEWLDSEFNFKNVVLMRHPVAFVESFTRNTSWDRHSICNSLVKQNNLLEKYDLLEYKNDLLKFSEMEINIKLTQSIGFDNEKLRIERASLIWNIFAKTYISYNKKHNWIFLKYEELASNPVESFRKVYKLLGIEFTIKHENKIQKYCSEGNKVKSKKFVDLKRDSKSLIRSWEKNMDPFDIEFIKSLTEKHGKQIYMDEF
ncbi:MAG: sulfotransferase domain-containing protein [Bacteroidetes bacterium]|nr:sulfotransferase domain-containing protein [Bacteroidota bacterium]